MFCGGSRCKYDSSTQWKSDEMALTGVFSHWITDEIVSNHSL
jgi:protein tyrosine phosphatase domain-containing protein 1